MPLTKEELLAQLKEIEDKEKAGKEGGPSATISIDLSDPAAIKRAKKLGLLPEDLDDDDDPEPDEGKEEPAKDEAPKRGAKRSLRQGYGDE